MKPDEGGKVAEGWLPRDRRYYSVKGERYPMRRFGTAYGDLTKQLTAMQKEEGGKKRPTQIWITSLCSYWYESVAEVCRIIRQIMPDTQVALLGQYARPMPKHAAEACAAAYVVSKPPDLSGVPLLRSWPAGLVVGLRQYLPERQHPPIEHQVEGR
jgi:hypothetical protein